MNDPASPPSSSRSIGRTVVAALILVVVVWLLLGFVIHIVSFLFSAAVFVVLVLAVIWALRTIF
jgi:hypothetical protein